MPGSGARKPATSSSAAVATLRRSSTVALVGAAVREVGPGVGLGVHSASIRFFERHTHATLRPAQHVVRAAMAKHYDSIARYLREMGINPDLLRAAREIEHDQVRYLTRAEITRFNIDRRTFIESEWTIIDRSPRSVRKLFLSENKAGWVSITCGMSDQLRFYYAREVLAGEVSGLVVKLAVGEVKRALFPVRRTTSWGTKSEYDISGTYLPPSSLLGSSEIAISTGLETPQDTALKLSAAGLAHALPNLLPSCLGGPSVPVTAKQ